MQIDKPTFIKSMETIKAYKDRLDGLYDDIERVIGGCEAFANRIDGVDDMIKLLELACGNSRFIAMYAYDADWGKWDTKLVTDSGREFPFRTLDNLWAVLNYPMPWELKLVLC